VLLKPLAAEFAWTRQQVATAFAIAAGVAALCAAPLGRLLDRVPPQRIAVPSLVLLGVGFASLALLTASLAHLYLIFAVLGAAGMGTSPVAYGRAISTWFARRRGMALAVVITGGAVGGVVLPPLAQALVRGMGWRGACLALGLAVLAIGVPVVARFVRERTPERTGAAEATGSPLAEGLRSPWFWVLVAGILCGTMVQNSVIVHLAALLTDRGIAPERAAVALSVMAGAAVAGRLATGFLIDRLHAPRVGLAMMGLAAAGAWLLSGASSFPVAVLAAALVGFGTGGEADVVPYLLSRYFGLRSFSTLYGCAWMAGAVGGAFGPVLMGRAFDATGSYQQTLVRLAVAALVAAALMLVLPRGESRVSAARP